MTVGVVEKPVLSGWCSAPAGARKKCRVCRWDLCQCDCHTTDHPRKDTT